MLSTQQELIASEIPQIVNPEINIATTLELNLDSIMDPEMLTKEMMIELLGEDFEMDTTHWTPPKETHDWKIAPDATESFKQIAAENGCTTQQYEVTTEDGYELVMFRIAKNGVAPTKPPVMLQHGLFADATTWIVNDELSPAFQLVELGYDIWFGNNRGNVYSRHNTKINPDKDPKDFFHYSFY